MRMTKLWTHYFINLTKNTMNHLIIYHNQQCSKSRKALELLENKGFKPQIIEYLKTPLSEENLRRLASHFSLEEFVRSEEKLFKDLKLSLENKEEIFQALLQHPILMQRPIVCFHDRALIGRPPEKILELFASS